MVEISSHCHVIVFFGGVGVKPDSKPQRQSTSKVGENGAGRCSTHGWSFLPTISEIRKVPLEDTP